VLLFEVTSPALWAGHSE